jgi:hypothetical protein
MKLLPVEGLVFVWVAGIGDILGDAFLGCLRYSASPQLSRVLGLGGGA